MSQRKFSILNPYLPLAGAAVCKELKGGKKQKNMQVETDELGTRAMYPVPVFPARNTKCEKS